MLNWPYLIWSTCTFITDLNNCTTALIIELDKHESVKMCKLKIHIYLVFKNSFFYERFKKIKHVVRVIKLAIRVICMKRVILKSTEHIYFSLHNECFKAFSFF